MLQLDPENPRTRTTALALCGVVVLAFAAVALMPDDASDTTSGAAVATRGAPAASTQAASTETASGEVAKSSRPAPRAPRAPDVLPTGRAVLSLVSVLALILITAVGASRWMKKLRIRPGGDRVLDVVDAVPLGPKRQVYVVSAYGRRLVIGASGDQLCLLSEIDEEETGEVAPTPFGVRLDRRLDQQPTSLEAEA